jgi:prepilin-type N-terminal cleavage/methylation domain-containing protein
MATRIRPTQASQTPTHARAFTLVELLVVISIIALLISILLPSLRSARDQAKLLKCLAHMRGTGTGMANFASDHDGRIQLTASEGIVEAEDPGRTKYAYGDGGELLSWPAAVAQASGIDLRNNWDWGVRAVNYVGAKAKERLINDQYDSLLCPSDRMQISSPFFPRFGGGYGDGLKGMGDPKDPTSPSDRMAYWGRLSFGINEDIAGGDGADRDFYPACWRAVPQGEKWIGCEGGVQYGPSSPCFRGQGKRLRGVLDRIFDPGTVGLVFETGPESEEQAIAVSNSSSDEFVNLILSMRHPAGAQPGGPNLGHAQQQFSTRIPTNRHPKGRLNVLFADMHGKTVQAVRYNGTTAYSRSPLPVEYSPPVRVSPYSIRGWQEE